MGNEQREAHVKVVKSCPLDRFDSDYTHIHMQ